MDDALAAVAELYAAGQLEAATEALADYVNNDLKDEVARAFAAARLFLLVNDEQAALLELDQAIEITRGQLGILTSGTDVREERHYQAEIRRTRAAMEAGRVRRIRRYRTRSRLATRARALGVRRRGASRAQRPTCTRGSPRQRADAEPPELEPPDGGEPS